MQKEPTITTEYFNIYRRQLGFTNQASVKNFLGAKDIVASVDYNYVSLLNNRLFDIVEKINGVVSDDIKTRNLNDFQKENIDHAFAIIKNNNILPILNNQGRRPEEVYYNWMRGFVFSNYFLKALGLIFETDETNIDLIGDDDLKKIETFKRTPKADIEVKIGNDKIRVEMQTGFTGINDIKQHKVLEAKKVFLEQGHETIAIHFDLYNGQVAFIKLNEIESNNMSWVSRQQMEGQTVFNIDQNYFVWKITESPVKYKDIQFN